MTQNFKPKYLGITLDRSLTFKSHIDTLSMKLRTRLNVIRVLAGTDWGASPETLRTSTIALMSGTINYISPVWLNSAHASKIDVQFNAALRIISGTLRSTPLEWLYVLSNIPPPHLSRKISYKNIITKSIIYENSLLYKILEEPTTYQRLKSREPWDKTFENVRNFSLTDEWKIAWENGQVVNSDLISDPTSNSKSAWIQLRTQSLEKPQQNQNKLWQMQLQFKQMEND